MEQFKNIANYAIFVALVLYIIGRLMNNGLLCYIGLGIMILSCIWTIIHWKQNTTLTNWIAVAFLLGVGLSFLGI